MASSLPVVGKIETKTGAHRGGSALDRVGGGSRKRLNTKSDTMFSVVGSRAEYRTGGTRKDFAYRIAR